jgi:hypothetical protein
VFDRHALVMCQIRCRGALPPLQVLLGQSVAEPPTQFIIAACGVDNLAQTTIDAVTIVSDNLSVTANRLKASAFDILTKKVLAFLENLAWRCKVCPSFLPLLSVCHIGSQFNSPVFRLIQEDLQEPTHG